MTFIGGEVLTIGANLESPVWIPAPGGENWWEAGGTTGVVAAYQPKGAADYAASKINIANPGIFNATDGSAAGWNISTGWIFGSGRYLVTGIIPLSTWTALIRCDMITDPIALFGISAASSLFRVYANFGGQAYYGNGDQTPFSPGFSSGVIGFSGLLAYRNGVFDGTISGVGYAGTLLDVFIGCQNEDGTPSAFSTNSTQAFVIYNNTLSAPKIAAVSAAMALL